MPSGKVTALGRIRPYGGVLTIGIPFPDRLLEIMPGIEVGKKVAKDAPLVKLESFIDRQLELNLITQQLNEARARLTAIVKSGTARIELEKLHLTQLEKLSPIDAKLQDLKIKLLGQQQTLAEVNLKRLKALDAASVSQQELEQRQMAVSQAQSELEVAKAQQKKMAQAVAVNLALAQASVAAAEGVLEEARASISLEALEQKRQLAAELFRRTVLRAPQQGVVLKFLARPGELVGGQQAVLQLADTARMAVVAEVYETDIRRVRQGQKARVTGRALGDQVLTGKVVQVGSFVGKNLVTDVDPTAAVDRRIIEVKIELEEAGPASPLINHQVTVEILP